MTAPPAFRVATLNLLHDPPRLTWRNRAPLVEAGLRTLRPDILLLQEVAWPDEQATTLAKALHTHTGRPYDAHVVGLFAANGWREGLAILSRFECLDHATLTYPGAEIFCHRARFDIDDRIVDVYNCHLDPYRQERRVRQTTMAMTWIEEAQDADAVVFGGDLNGIPASVEIAPLSARLRSAYAVAHGRDPDRVIDYLWVSPALSIVAADFALDQPADDDPLLMPSDHLALYADLAWQPRVH